MEFSAKMIADFLKGEIVGNPDVVVTSVCGIENGKKGGLSYISDLKYAKHLYNSEASIVLVSKVFVPEQAVKATLIKVEDPRFAMSSLLELYESSLPQKKGIDKLSSIHESAKIGNDVYIGAFAVIDENAKIGNNVKIYPHVYVGDNVEIMDGTILYSGVKIYKDCKIGNYCIIHAGAVIGADGFGFVPSAANNYKKIPQIGNTVLEDYVEIGANTCVDRAMMGTTIIRKGVKLDNLVQIGHNVEVGENTVMSSQVGIAGSSRVGKNCMFGGQVGLADHITVADGVKIGAQAGLASSVKDENVTLLGAPAIEIKQFIKSSLVFKTLPEMAKQIRAMEKELEVMKGKINLDQ
jgi:UDP-3-O-[3-hydroxymyristoyl] glucosamine N-acyltransferase